MTGFFHQHPLEIPRFMAMPANQLKEKTTGTVNPNTINVARNVLPKNRIITNMTTKRVL